MKEFFDDNLFLENSTAKDLYKEIRHLPIVDYHCHLDDKMMIDDAKFSDIGELWLAGDHYKWRAMRLNGVDEKYITGNASYHDKFIKYAEIMPNLIGNPLYYWTHLELRQIFGINEPLNKESAERIFSKANEKLKDLSVLKLFDMFNIEFIATTNDPTETLPNHKRYNNTLVTPTFRPDKLYNFDEKYIEELGKVAGIKIDTLTDFENAIKQRLDYFCSKGCRISDHGFEKFPESYATRDMAEKLFVNRLNLSDTEKDSLLGYLLLFLTNQYYERNMAMQIHFAVIRNINEEGFKNCGVDSGYDVMSEMPSVKNVMKFLQQTKDSCRPKTILYTLNDSNLSSIACLTGAFRNVIMGASWWFNDTVEGIKRNLKIIAEYSSLGNNLGMLTDSRSFSSYPRFDFYRRILCDYVGDKVEKGEYDKNSALELVKNVCYYNAKRTVNNG